MQTFLVLYKIPRNSNAHRNFISSGTKSKKMHVKIKLILKVKMKLGICIFYYLSSGVFIVMIIFYYSSLGISLFLSLNYLVGSFFLFYPQNW